MSSKSTSANERVKVYCRLRPQIIQEATPEDLEDPTFVTGTTTTSNGEAAVAIPTPEKSPRNGRLMFRDGTNAKEFEFDGCFAQDTTQAFVYQTVASDLVQSVLQGYNATIMAYGQTGSGKTHTMMGGDDQGIIPRCLTDLFESRNCTRIHLSYVQIYCERVFDVLEPSTASTALSIRENEEDGVFVDGVQKRLVHNVEECLHWIQVGNANRTVAATKMNAHSSRSHAIISMHVERIDSSQSKNEIVQKSQFHLVDLAGSERVKKSLIRGTHVNELKAINLSLSALGNCISALSKQQSHIPYRDSKLTRLLQYSLGGNAKTALVLTVTPEMTEASESHATLQFGQRAMQIQVQARVNIVPDYKRLVEQLQAKVDAYEDKLNGMDIELQSSRDQQALLLNQLDEAKVDTSKFAFEVEALKTAMQMQTTIIHHQKTPHDGQENKCNDEVNTSPSIATNEILEQMEAKLHELTMQHRKELNTLKQRFDFQVETHKQVANRANQEWQNIEHELSSERTAHLETCRELRESKEKYFFLESNHIDRIAEMCQEKKELELQNQAQLKLIQQLQATTSLLELKVKELQQGKSELSLSIDANFVNEMETLYSDAITKLQLRVESLEANKATKAPEPVRLPAPMTRKDSLVKKAVPKIGRVMPGGRR
ncbi:kinesin [Thraustotheca clavata]|uniref:Kinesin-like protein n=1 Tax=Thraustotheca clavata TaxID=74557 RepID=A0A1V9ZP95_9STRA|nr:kinesin [Thraustotheca clavata]